MAENGLLFSIEDPRKDSLPWLPFFLSLRGLSSRLPTSKQVLLRCVIACLLMALGSVGSVHAQPFVDPVPNWDPNQGGQRYACEGCVNAGCPGTKFHTGIDMRPSDYMFDGTNYTVPVTSATPGKVVNIFRVEDDDENGGSKDNHGLGNAVIIKHKTEDFYLLYGHLDSIQPGLDIGDDVSEGTQIGIMGHSSQGTRRSSEPDFLPHLHFEIKQRPVVGNLGDKAGPCDKDFYGYTPDVPNFYGYRNPRPYLDNEVIPIAPIKVRTTAPHNVQTGPGAGYTVKVDSVGPNRKFVAIAEQGNWYQVYLPSLFGPATGWIQGVKEDTAAIFRVSYGTTYNWDAVNVRWEPDISSTNKISAVWNDQYIVGLGTDPCSSSGECRKCSKGWRQINLPDSSGSSMGWVCDNFLTPEGGTSEIPGEPITVIDECTPGIPDGVFRGFGGSQFAGTEEVIFRADVDTNSDGFADRDGFFRQSSSGSSIQKIVATSETTPTDIGLLTFSQIDGNPPPANTAGEFLFVGHYDSQHSLLLASAEGIEERFTSGESVTVRRGSGTFTSLRPGPVNNAGDFAFTADILVAGQNLSHLFLAPNTDCAPEYSSACLIEVAAAEEQTGVSEVGGTYDVLLDGGILTTNGDLVFRAIVISGQTPTAYLRYHTNSGSITKVVAVGDSSPSGPNYASVGGADMRQGGPLVFEANLVGGGSGIYRMPINSSPSAAMKIAEVDQQIVTDIGTLTLVGISQPTVDARGSAAYRARYTGATTPGDFTRRGVFYWTDERTIRIDTTGSSPKLSDIGHLVYLEPDATPGTCSGSGAFFSIGVATAFAAGSADSPFGASVPTDPPVLCTCLPGTCGAVCEATEPGDTDDDQRCDICDNCPTIFNYDQADINSDGIGDACEPFCGNGILDFGEECDNGGSNSDTTPDACRTDCTLPICGDGVVDKGEECDDGNTVVGDGCSSTCLSEFCGDGVLQAGLGETCDDGNTLDGDGCSASCQIESGGSLCGNGTVEAGEECDDGNMVGGDGCSAVCQIECPSSNLALCATATVSSSWSASYDATKANDGDLSTRWNSASGDKVGAWLALDFSAPTPFDTIVLKEALNRITGYALQYWDGAQWQDIVSGASIGASKTHAFSAITSEAVRLLVTGLTSGSAWVTPTIFEFEVYNNAVEHTLTITSGPTGNPNLVASEGTVSLSVSATDSLGHSLSHAWTAACSGLESGGSFSDPNVPAPIWTAPTNTTGSEQSCTIEVTVNDGQGLSQSGSYSQGISSVSCTYSIFPTNRSHGSVAETGMVSVTAPDGCSWTAVSNDNWIAITSGSSGSGDGTVSYTVKANGNASQRIGSLTIAGQPFAVTQAGITGIPPCAFANLALCATATVSSSWSASYDAAKANDGNGSTRWNSASGDKVGAWLELDFGQPETFNSIILTEAINRITGYALQQWNGTQWQNIVSGTTIGTSKEHSFATLSSQKVRLLVTSLTSGSSWVTPTISEFEVYSNGDVDHTLMITDGPSGNPNPVVSEGTVSLSVSAMDSLGHSLSHAWTAACSWIGSDGSFSDPNVPAPIWTAPTNTTGSEQSCTIEVTVNDGQGLSDSGSYVQGVSSDTSDTIPPTNVQVTAPGSGQTISGVFSLQGTAQDDSSTIGKMEFYIDADSTPACSDTTPQPSGSTFQCDWDTTTKPDGSYTVTVEAYDPSGNSTVSPPVSFTIDNAAPPCAFSNLALCATTTASSSWSASYDAAKANDGDLSTRWNSANGDKVGAWLELDFGTPTTFDTIVLKEAINRITGYTLQSWDGTQWQDIVSGTTIGTSKEHSFATLSSQKVRLLVTSLTSGSSWVTPTISEFEVYDSANIIFSDSFNRADSLVVGNGWTEVDGGNLNSSIESNTLKLSQTGGLPANPNDGQDTRIYRYSAQHNDIVLSGTLNISMSGPGGAQQVARVVVSSDGTAGTGDPIQPPCGVGAHTPPNCWQGDGYGFSAWADNIDLNGSRLLQIVDDGIELAEAFFPFVNGQTVQWEMEINNLNHIALFMWTGAKPAVPTLEFTNSGNPYTPVANGDFWQIEVKNTNDLIGSSHAHTATWDDFQVASLN